MTPAFILWCIPGYLALFIFQLVKPARNRSGWDFVLQVAVMAVFCFIVAFALITAGKFLLPCLATPLIEFWSKSEAGHHAHSFSLVIGIFIGAPCVGVVTSLLWTNKTVQNFISAYTHWLTGRARNLGYSDTFFATCNDLLGKPVLIILTSGKVYVGLLIQATEDPNETHRFIKITPAISGHRDKENFQVVFTTEYLGSASDVSSLPNRDILISMNQVSTLAPFDEKLHDHFIAAGITRLDTGFVAR